MLRFSKNLVKQRQIKETLHKGSAVYGRLFSLAMLMLMVVNVQMPHFYALMESNNNTLE